MGTRGGVRFAPLLVVTLASALETSVHLIVEHKSLRHQSVGVEMRRAARNI